MCTVAHISDVHRIPTSAAAQKGFAGIHPFRDGNGRLGRYLIVHNLLATGLLSEPTLTVSPWFEARRGEYYDHLFHVSTDGQWDAYLRFFATGLKQAAESTHRQMLTLSRVQAELKEDIRASSIRPENTYRRRFYAPRLLEVLTKDSS